MNLALLEQRLSNRLDELDKHFLIIASRFKGPREQSFEDRLILEGLISQAWQFWCLFCRNTLINSALGCQSRSGPVPPATHVAPLTWERISHIAARAAQGGKIQPLATNSVLRSEPTWGDVDKLQKILGALAPHNSALLATGFGGATLVKHVQIIRNASAHRNRQTLKEVAVLNSRYSAFRVYFPSDAALWEDPTSQSFAFLAWTDEMRLTASLAIG